MSRYRWILFDADNTLFDFDRSERSALTRTLGAFGVPVDDAVAARYRGISVDLWRAFEAGEVSSAELRVLRFVRLLEPLRPLHPLIDPEVVSRAYLGEIGRESHLLPGAEEVVRTVARTHRLVLATNGIAEVQRARFSAATIRDCFAHVVISDEIGSAKPQRAFFDEAFRRMGDPAREEVLMVGDSLSSDIAGGIGYGIDTCWMAADASAPDPHPAPTYRIARIEALLPLLA